MPERISNQHQEAKKRNQRRQKNSSSAKRSPVTAEERLLRYERQEIRQRLRQEQKERELLEAKRKSQRLNLTSYTKGQTFAEKAQGFVIDNPTIIQDLLKSHQPESGTITYAIFPVTLPLILAIFDNEAIAVNPELRCTSESIRLFMGASTHGYQVFTVKNDMSANYERFVKAIGLEKDPITKPFHALFDEYDLPHFIGMDIAGYLETPERRISERVPITLA